MAPAPTSAHLPRRWALTLAGALMVATPSAVVAAPAAAAGASTPATGAAAAAPVAAAVTKRVYQLGERTLRPGDRGKDVRKLQKLLSVKKTGHFNKRTGKKVRKVERKYGLTVDTVVDAQTLAAIKKYAKAKAKRKARSSRGAGGSSASAKRYASAYIDDKYGWGDKQMSCLIRMWQRESGWNFQASNPNGRYHGIPQTSAAVWGAQGFSRSEYMGSAAVQVRVGAKYIKGRYDSPCGAWSFWKSHHWY